MGGRVRRLSLFVRLAQVHAPKGGVAVGGKKFKGGEFIPGEVLEKATREEKAKIEGERQSNVPEWIETANLFNPDFDDDAGDRFEGEGDVEFVEREERRQVRMSTRSQFLTSLVRSDISDKAKGDRLESVDDTLAFMPSQTMRRLRRNLKDTRWYEDHQSLTKAMDAPEIKGVVGGAFQRVGGGGGRGILHLAGDKFKSGKGGIFAHEFAHVVDNWNGGIKISNQTAWQMAWESEIVATGELSNYALTNAEEGFAEFMRLAWSSKRGRAKALFPQCFKVASHFGVI